MNFSLPEVSFLFLVNNSFRIASIFIFEISIRPSPYVPLVPITDETDFTIDVVPPARSIASPLREFFLVNADVYTLFTTLLDPVPFNE